MNKRGMSLVTLTIALILVIGTFCVTMTGLTKTNLRQTIEKNADDMDLLNIQQQANMAYASIYFDNLRQGVRRELTADEIRLRMLKNGTGDIDLSKYNIVVKDGDVFVSLKSNIMGEPEEQKK